ncbi:MAG: 2-amino-4-hydroxy-6-hydroxymethyldihydropteridine diphosphokinase [Xanthomonadales bacterium]|nr:2-amino-4-hydroxy-6-hydroxymethyldihydropteridine diphosphokinase [Gammaproteobacteria bacterium]NNE04159.1 2-amino-4-hydroxy-6-hydroxymethyldihydropteridine diphosphokinase [Xanthomonadales bacterium]NNL94341.1 2-amino-4-hydroxy-6-hydroxymethyldihydropteridine diphosphokinase [Xanthomonadales bacterium]
MTNTAYLGLGSNVDAERHIRIAIDALRQRFGGVVISPVYRSKAVGFDGEDFLNLAASIETSLGPYDLRSFLRDLEGQHGRDRAAPKWSDRTLDIDILLIDDLVIYDDELEIPRREILKFAHVLVPLADIAPDVTFPGHDRTLAELRDSLSLDESSLAPARINFPS